MEYESKFDNLVEDWQHNIKELVKKLVKRDDVDSLFCVFVDGFTEDVVDEDEIGTVEIF